MVGSRVGACAGRRIVGGLEDDAVAARGRDRLDVAKLETEVSVEEVREEVGLAEGRFGGEARLGTALLVLMRERAHASRIEDREPRMGRFSRVLRARDEHGACVDDRPALLALLRGIPDGGEVELG